LFKDPVENKTALGGDFMGSDVVLLAANAVLAQRREKLIILKAFKGLEVSLSHFNRISTQRCFLLLLCFFFVVFFSLFRHDMGRTLCNFLFSFSLQ
jgi:hypothetical protein